MSPRQNVGFDGLICEGLMSDNERTILDMIRNSDDPGKAVLIAIDVFTSFLAQLEEAQLPQPACLQESA